LTENNLKCEIFPCCTFFSKEIKSDLIASKFREKYCNSCKEACARYIVLSAKSIDHVPDDLFPNEYDKALKILSEN